LYLPIFNNFSNNFSVNNKVFTRGG
jgi:hypothetical protein